MSGDGAPRGDVTAGLVTADHVTVGDVARAWWPLCASWLLMAAEQPAIAAVVARLDDAQTQLAAWGVVFAFALVIEAPVIMMLAASTELVRDRASHRALRRIAHRMGATLSVVHLGLAATPAFDWVVGGALGVPELVLEPARWGLLIATPWSWAIVWRRFNQGILIRFGHARAVGFGTSLRLGGNAAVLGLGAWLGIPGTMLAALALVSGAAIEAVWIALRVRRVVAERLVHVDPDRPPLEGRAFRAFYVPLAVTQVVTLAVQPLGTAAVARLPEVLASMATWPVVNALSFVLAAPGLALNEVVVALWDRPGGPAALWRFTGWLAAVTSGIAALLVVSPLGALWFGEVGGLPGELVALAGTALFVVVPAPASRVLQSWYQGRLVAQRRTTVVSAGVVVFAIVTAVGIGIAMVLPVPGLISVLAAFMAGRVAQTGYLGWRCAR